MTARSRPIRMAAAALIVLAAGPIEAKMFVTQEEALRLAFPAGAKVERRTAFLTPSQQASATKLAGGTRPPSALVSFYVGIRDGHEIGTAYFDTHVVRTESETLMILIDPGGAISRIEVLSFAEPEEYLPREHWYGQFSGKKLDAELSLSRSIRPVAGATLTARATTDAARRVLAIHQLLHAKTAGP